MTLRVLLLAYEFPPLASSGVHRALAFARELPKFDIELEVVTVHVSDYAAWSSASQDSALLDRLPVHARVHRIASGFPDWYWSVRRHPLGCALTHYLPLGDPVSTFWRAPLTSLLDTLMPRFQPQVLLATAPPFGVAMLGRHISQRYRLPWVADLRDPWTHWGVVPFATRAHYWYARHAENRILESANIAVATSPVTRAQWLTEWPTLSPDRIVTIFNGYDTTKSAVKGSGDLSPEKNIPPHRAEGEGEGVRGRGGRASGMFRVIHTGSFYYAKGKKRWWHYAPRKEDWLYRSPYFFLKGLRRLVDLSPELARRIEVVFAGTVPAWLPEMLRETGTETFVQLRGVVPHAESLELQRSADALLLTSAKIQNGRDYSIAGKLFEYFAARRPILGVLTDGAMRDLVAQSGLGVLADPDDAPSVANALRQIMSTGATPKPDETFLGSFEYRVTMRQMAECLHRAAGECGRT